MSESEPRFTSGCTEPEFPDWWEKFGAALSRDDRMNAEMIALAAFSAGKYRATLQRGAPEVCKQCGHWKQSPHCHCDTENAQLRAALDQAEQQREQLRDALARVRAHTSYLNPTEELLRGLLASIERIADRELLASPEKPRP